MQLHGILLLDKPAGYTSNQILQRIKRLLKVTSKAGHTGSLDPLATGMLPICFGEATKFSSFLLNADKSYQITMQLGIKTDTGDLTGEVLAREQNVDPKVFHEKWLELILAEFIGTNLQEPPMYSAIKSNGVPLYKLARKAKENQNNLHNVDLVLNPEFKLLVQSKAREIKIHKIKVLDLCAFQQKIFLEVECSKGTYIRSLVEDLGKRLKCYATVAELRRIQVAGFSSDRMITLEHLSSLMEQSKKDLISQENLLRNYLLPVEQCLMDFPRLDLDLEQSLALQQGKRIYINKINNLLGINKLVSLFRANDNRLLGLGEIISDNLLISKRLVTI